MTRKLMLELDALVVESFVTADAVPGRGTVRGHITLHCAPTDACDTENNTCDGAATCGEYTCNANDNTCLQSCGLCGTYKCGEGGGTTPACASDQLPGCYSSGVSCAPGC